MKTAIKIDNAAKLPGNAIKIISLVFLFSDKKCEKVVLRFIDDEPRVRSAGSIITATIRVEIEIGSRKKGTTIPISDRNNSAKRRTYFNRWI